MLDRTEYENFWYALQQKVDKLLAERNMSYRYLSIELGKSPGYIYSHLEYGAKVKSANKIAENLSLEEKTKDG